MISRILFLNFISLSIEGEICSSYEEDAGSLFCRTLCHESNILQPPSLSPSFIFRCLIGLINIVDCLIDGL